VNTVDEAGAGTYKHEKLDWLKEDKRRYVFILLGRLRVKKKTQAL